MSCTVGLRSPFCWVECMVRWMLPSRAAPMQLMQLIPWAWGGSRFAIYRRSVRITTGNGSLSFRDQGGIGQLIGPMQETLRERERFCS